MKKPDTDIAIKDFSYHLPQEKIASAPLVKRDESRLLLYREGEIKEDIFSQLPRHLPSHSLLVLNNTRVIEARIFFRKETGSRIEIFCLEPFEQSIEQAMAQKGKAVWKCLIGGASKWKPGQVLVKELEGTGRRLKARFVARLEEDFLIEFSWQPADTPFVEIIHEAGAIPLPPYIKREAEKDDNERYQTVFSRIDGSVAAPTAALHFTKEVFASLEEKNIKKAFLTLHVGAGTFKPVKAETIAGHHMHGEPFSVEKDTIKALLNHETIVAVGTTSLRTLESLYWIGVKIRKDVDAPAELSQWEAYELASETDLPTVKECLEGILDWMEKKKVSSIHCRTSLIIIPGYEIKIPHALVTNFHQPQSTLLLLVAAFIGEDWKKVYEYALQNDFRFLSYGDSSVLWKKDSQGLT